MKGRIPPDEGLLLAAQKHANGANVHKIRNLMDCYEVACWVGNRPSAVKCAKALREALHKTIKIQGTISKHIVIRCAICNNPTLPEAGQDFAICNQCHKKELGIGYLRRPF